MVHASSQYGFKSLGPSVPYSNEGSLMICDWTLSSRSQKICSMILVLVVYVTCDCLDHTKTAQVSIVTVISLNPFPRFICVEDKPILQVELHVFETKHL